MIDSSLIQKLHDERIINKEYLFWWQLGYEGREILSEDQFRQDLREISYWARDPREKDSEPFEVKLKVYVKDNVPILIKNIELCGIEMPCFITCCPMSHERGWRTFKGAVEFQFSPNMVELIYNQPHIRGVAVETTKDFLFWYPFYFGSKPDFYASSAVFFDRLDTWLIVDPVHPSKFYENLIKKEWHKGKRPQQKPQRFDYSLPGFDFKRVPYFEFDPTKQHFTIYPLPIFADKSSKMIRDLIKKNPEMSPETAQKLIDSYPFLFPIKKRLDLPVIIKSSNNKKVNLLGAGHLTEESAFYWKLSQQQYSLAKNTLKERLGLEAQEYI